MTDDAGSSARPLPRAGVTAGGESRERPAVPAPAGESLGKAAPRGPDPAAASSRDREANAHLVVARRNAVPFLILVLLVAMLLGALVGGFVAARSASVSTASTLLRLAPPASVSLTTGDVPPPSADEIAAFMAVEVAWLSSGAYPAEVAERLRLGSDPTVDVTRVDQSQVVMVTATAPDDAAALAIARAAVQVYTDRREAEGAARLESALEAIDRTIAEQEPVDPADTNAQARVQRLQDLRSEIQLRSSLDDNPVEVLDAPAIDENRGSAPWVLGALLGAIAGGLLAVVAIMFWRARTSTVLSASDTEELVGRVLQPEVELASRWADRLIADELTAERRTARLLLAQLSRRRALGGRVVAVLGTSAGSCSESVATMLAVAAAEHVPTTLVRLSPYRGTDDPLQRVRMPPDPTGWGRTLIQDLAIVDAGGDRLTRSGFTALLTRGSTSASFVVLDAGTAGGSHELLKVLLTADDTVLVMGIGVDRLPDVAAIAAAVETGQGDLVGVVTRASHRVARARRALLRGPNRD